MTLRTYIVTALIPPGAKLAGKRVFPGNSVVLDDVTEAPPELARGTVYLDGSAPPVAPPTFPEVRKIVYLSQEDYDDLAQPDPSTLYLVPEEE